MAEPQITGRLNGDTTQVDSELIIKEPLLLKILHLSQNAATTSKLIIYDKDAISIPEVLLGGNLPTINSALSRFDVVLAGVNHMEIPMDIFVEETIGFSYVSSAASQIGISIETERVLERQEITLSDTKDLLAEQSKVSIRQATKDITMSYDVTPGDTGRRVVAPGESGFQVKKPEEDIRQVGVEK